MQIRALSVATVTSGLAMGLLTSIANSANVAAVSTVNCICCGWAWIFTFFAVWLYKQLSAENVAMLPRHAVGVGILSSIVGGAVYGLAGFLILPPLLGSRSHVPTGSDLAALAGVLVVFCIIGAFGGLLGGAIMQDRPARYA